MSRFTSGWGHKRLLIAACVLCTLFAFVLTVNTVAAQSFAGGSGTSDDPYQIETCQQLQNMQNDLTASYELTADIDCSGFTFSTIGDFDNRFTGTFDGNHHRIDNLTSWDETDGNFGIIGYTDSNSKSVIKNVYIMDAYYEGSANGGFLGTSLFGADIQNVVVTGEIHTENANVNMGGLAASTEEGLQNVITNVTINQYIPNTEYDSEIGGVVASDAATTTKNVVALGEINITDDYQNTIGSRIAGVLVNSGGDVENAFGTAIASGAADKYDGTIYNSGGTLSNVYYNNDTKTMDSTGTPLSNSEIKGASAATNMNFDFTNEWETVEGSDIDATEDGYPILQSMDRIVQLEAQGVFANVYDVQITNTNSPVAPGDTVNVTVETEGPSDVDLYVNGTLEDSATGVDGQETLSFSRDTIGTYNVEVQSNGGNDTETVTVEMGEPTDRQQVWQDMAGDGTSTNPKVITNVKELQSISYDLSGHYVLGNDIDATHTTDWYNDTVSLENVGRADNTGTYSLAHENIIEGSVTVTIDGQTVADDDVIVDYQNGVFEANGTDFYSMGYGDNSWSNVNVEYNFDGFLGFDSLGSYSNNNDFTGSLDGQGHTIDGLFINRAWGRGAGLFERVNGATLENIHMTNVDISGNEYTGALVGDDNAHDGSTLIQDVSVSGQVYANLGEYEYYVGGVVGSLGGELRNATFDGDLTINDHADSRYVGGVVGQTGNDGFISQASASGTITSSSEYVGGVAGRNRGEIRYAHSTMDVSGSTPVGGLVGDNQGVIIEGYAAGSVSGGGGFTGQTSGTEYLTYWDTVASGQSTSPGSATGLTTSEMTGDAAQQNMDFSWESEWTTRDNDYPLANGEGMELSSSGPYFAVTMTDVNSSVLVGDEIHVTADIENVGSDPGTKDVELRVDGATVDTIANVSLDANQKTTVDFVYTAQSTDTPEIITGVHTEDSEDQATVDVTSESNFQVGIQSMNDPVVEGDDLTVDVNVTNTGTTEATKEVNLTVDGTVAAAENVTVPSGESATVSLTYTTTTGDAPDVGVQVASEDDTATATAQVHEPASFDVNITGTNTPVDEGDPLDVTVDVTNTGDAQGTQTISLTLNEVEDSTTLTLSGGETQTVTLSWLTEAGDGGSGYTAEVASENTTSTEAVKVDDPAYFQVDDVDAEDTSTENTDANIHTTITNDGEFEATQTVTLYLEDPNTGDLVEDQNMTVTLDPYETRTVTFDWNATTQDKGTWNVEVRTEDDSGTDTVNVDVGIEGIHEVRLADDLSHNTTTDVIVIAELTNGGTERRSANLSSYNEDVVSVDTTNQTATGHTPGSTTITASVTDGGATHEATLDVTVEERTFTDITMGWALVLLGITGAVLWIGLKNSGFAGLVLMGSQILIAGGHILGVLVAGEFILGSLILGMLGVFLEVTS